MEQCALILPLILPRKHADASVTLHPRRLFWDMRVMKEEKAGDFSWNPLFKVQMNSIDGVGDLSACVPAPSTPPTPSLIC
jgi:hypothetical protein